MHSNKFGMLKLMKDKIMAQSNKEASASGAIDVLNRLRRSQEQDIQKNDDPPIAGDESIIEISPELIHRWEGKDRPENELGNIEELAKQMKEVGQQVPCIVRHHKSLTGEYELIVGERRWKAATLENLKLKAIVKDVDDRLASLVQAVENDRKDLSDFAKGMSFAKKIDQGILKQKDLIDVLQISKQQVSRLLSFNRIPVPLFKAIGDFRKVSARTAYELSRIGNKSEDHLNALIQIADKVRSGKLGSESVIRSVNNQIDKSSKHGVATKVLSPTGQHLFTERLDNNYLRSYHLPKNIEGAIDHEYIKEALKNAIIDCLSK